jgi:MFS family permease
MGQATTYSIMKPALRNPWALLVCGGLILFFCLGQRHSFGLFLRPMTSQLGWGRETFSIALALQNLVWGLAQPVSGIIADKFGSHRVLLLGAMAYALGVFLMAFSPDGLTFALSAGLLVGFGLSGTAFGIVYGAVGRAFSPEKRANALGLVGAIGGLGQFMMLPLNQALINSLGWASALIALSAVCALMMPLAFGCVERIDTPKGPSQCLGEALKEAFGHTGFWLLTIGFLTCGFQLAFITTHLPAYMADKAVSANIAVTALAIIALSNILGTYLCGYLGGRYSKKYLLSGTYFVRGVSILAFVALPITPLSTYLFAAVMGLIWLGTVPLTNGLVGQIFGLQYVSTLFGFVFLSHQIGGFLGVWLGGMLFDRSGSYEIVWILSIGLSVLAAVVNLPINEREIARTAMKPA